MRRHGDEDLGELRFGSRVAFGAMLAILLVLGGGGWAAVAKISGSVIAQGTVKVDQNLKLVQHRDGGIVSHIAVREGHFVSAGAIMVRLDDVQTRAELSIVRSQLSELLARRARLTAERDGLEIIQIPVNAAVPITYDDLVAFGEIRLFEGNRKNRESQKEQLRSEIIQLQEEIKGLEAQHAAKEQELELVRQEHEKLAVLATQKLVETSRLYSITRDLARLTGEIGEIDAAIARARARISSINLQILTIDENARTEAQRELSAVAARISELNDRRIALEDRLARTDIRAPISGIVNELSVHTIGGVITSAETIATIVPENAKLKVEARIPPADIDQVFVGRLAKLRFSAFNQRVTPELNGEIVYVSPATTRDASTNAVHYVAHVQIGPGEFVKLGGQSLKPGMPVEVFIATEERSAFTYLAKPFLDQFTKAFREE